ncbi:hypothetical protein NKR23_g4823 [Pleurostoma richardsiae]|uniref:DUF7702 domain-containing protein n=1 Tax=Pleurostoma richardsiae TaxID=41990 RepID=A0AA38VRB2_9PEZI|nr:hypothetical protein NKR23_g4823 [Pleurostoma richardsiae]
MTSADTAFAAVVLSIYTALSVPTIYVTYRHGIKGWAFLGWGFLFIFCTLKIVGSALQISNPRSTGAAIVSSVGLSPLTLALGGVLHEARHNLFDLTTQQVQWETIGYLILHILVGAAIGPLAAGASNIPSDISSPSKLRSDYDMAGAGAVIMLLIVAGVFAKALTSRAGNDAQSQSTVPGRRRRQQLGGRLVSAVLVAAAFLAIRVIASVVYFFSRNQNLNPVGGNWAYHVCMYFLPELAAALVLLTAGLATRGVTREKEVEGPVQLS